MKNKEYTEDSSKENDQIESKELFIVSSSSNKSTKKILIAAGSILCTLLIFMGTKIFAGSINQIKGVDISQVPDKSKDKLDIVSQEEKQKRNQVDQHLASDAALNGQSFQAPLFIEQNNLPTVQPSFSPLPIPIVESSSTITAPLPSINIIQPPEDKELDNKLKENISKQAESIINNQSSGYSSIKYPNTIKTPSIDSDNKSLDMDDEEKKKKIIFKAGDIMYATLITGINTDDGNNNILAKLYGGPYNGATLIGNILQTNKNISLNFTQLSPQDRNKKSFPINAIAIRQQDARQGIAQKIDNHVLERYSYLFASSILKAVGSAAQGTTETFIGQGGTILQTQQNNADVKTIAKRSAGEIGNTMSSELGRNFNRPPTYTVPANQGIGILFINDVED